MDVHFVGFFPADNGCNSDEASAAVRVISEGFRFMRAIGFKEFWESVMKEARTAAYEQVHCMNRKDCHDRLVRGKVSSHTCAFF